MPWVGFETTIPPFERTKKFHTLDRGVTVIDLIDITFWIKKGNE
jgi:hypothetical protein